MSVLLTGHQNRDEGMSGVEKRMNLLTLHHQFGRANAAKLAQLLKSADIKDRHSLILLQEVVDGCDTCRKFKKPSPRPAVGLPRTSDFNDTVAVELHQLGSNIWYLHMINEFSTFSSTCIVYDKKPETFIEMFIKHWISFYGAPKRLVSDNGGEFNNESVRDICEIFALKL